MFAWFGKYRQMDMLHGSLWDKILVFAIPLAVTALLQQLYNTTDTMVLGRLVGDDAMAAVGNNIPIIGLIVSLFVGMSLGANVVMARYIGQGDLKNANRTIYTSINFALVSGIAVAVPGCLLADEITALLDVPAELVDYASGYLFWYMAGMPFLALFNFEAAMFRSVGDTTTPLIALALASAFNAAADLVAVHLGMGPGGVAAATSLANLLSAAYLFWRLYKSEGVLKLDCKKLRLFEMRKARAMLFIGLPAGIQGMVFSVSNIVIQSAINSLGALTMAASAAAFAYEVNFYVFMMAFGMAATTFIGQNYGALNIPRCRAVVKDSMLLGFAVCALLTVVLIFSGRFLLSLISTDPVVIELGMLRIFWIPCFYLICVPFEVLSGAMRGYGYSLPPALATMFCIVGERLVWVFTVFKADPTFETLLITYPVSWLVCCPFIIALYLWLMRKLKKKHGNAAADQLSAGA